MVSRDNITALRHLNVETLGLLREVLLGMDTPLYISLNRKANATLGQHVRHSLEFYRCLFEGGRVVNYDDRKRDLLLETSVEHALVCIDATIRNIEDVHKDHSVKLLAEMPTVSHVPLELNTTLCRELLYVLEHTIHHMALMRVLIKDEDAEFVLPESFGVAYSTLAYREQLAQG